MSKIIRINNITEQELRDLKNLEQDRLRLHLPPAPVTFLKLDVHLKGEHVLEYKSLSHSWVRNFYNTLTSYMLDLSSAAGGTVFGPGALPIKEIGGNTRSDAESKISIGTSEAGGFIGGAGITTRGIVVGTGNAAESFEDFKLNSLISNGTGAGQFSYSAQNLGTGSYDPVTKEFTATHVRVMNNNSGGDIDVAEVGLYAFTQIVLNYNTMLIRDIVTPVVTVANTAQLTVTYELKVTYPS